MRCKNCAWVMKINENLRHVIKSHERNMRELIKERDKILKKMKGGNENGKNN